MCVYDAVFYMTLVILLPTLLPVDVTEAAWSGVYKDANPSDGVQRYALLFVAMKNGDVVTFKICIPLTAL